MKEETRQLKVDKILEATENILSSNGIKSTKMEEIADAAGLTKVTLYSYFESRENLIMALTYRITKRLLDKYTALLEDYRHESGLKSSLAISEMFVNFVENNFLYSELFLKYFHLVRSIDSHDSDDRFNLKNSEYFMKMQEIHNMPFKLMASQIKRGQEDGSIKPYIVPMSATIMAWSASIGYITLLSNIKDSAKPLFNINLEQLKYNQLRVFARMLKND